MKKITKPANRACVTRQNTKAIMEACKNINLDMCLIVMEQQHKN